MEKAKSRTYSSISKKRLLEEFENTTVEVSENNRYFEGILKASGRFIEIHTKDKVYSIEKDHLSKRSINELGYFKPFSRILVTIRQVR